MSLDDVIIEWQSKPRKMGCVAATQWLCKRVKGFYPIRVERYTQHGEVYQHVIATNGIITIDLAPYADAPKSVDMDVIT